MSEKKRVLLICLGNICRSPIAEAIFNEEIDRKNLRNCWDVDSAALIQFHVGNKPDYRALKVLRKNGITNYHHIVRQITQDDFNDFDWILCMDDDNLHQLNKMKPENCRAKVELLGNYDSQGIVVIRDPYYDSDSEGFEEVYEQCARSVIEFLKENTKQ